VIWFWQLKRNGFRFAAHELWELLAQLCHIRKVEKVHDRKLP
jgi:hypothetical protein